MAAAAPEALSLLYSILLVKAFKLLKDIIYGAPRFLVILKQQQQGLTSKRIFEDDCGRESCTHENCTVNSCVCLCAPP